MMQKELILGDCLEALKKMQDNSIDAVVTDPPYGLAFMGKKWDYDVPSVEIWAECLRVLKPGGYLLAFAGTRTQHRMAVRIEDAGFEIRDMIAWVYGSGFPKSLDVSKAIDKQAGAEREIVRQNHNWRDVTGHVTHSYGQGKGINVRNPHITAPATEEAKQWEGWGTALKPALEPITVARKPLSEKTVAENVLKWGTGGINIDGSRVGSETITTQGGDKFKGKGIYGKYNTFQETEHQGRFPANFIHDGSEEVVGLFPDSKSTGGQASLGAFRNGDVYGKGLDEREIRDPGYGDTGSAARFFYCAKASKSERGESNNHPTVKPVKLMQYLVNLVSTEGATILDPFCGSGSTGVACRNTNRNFIGIEKDESYFEIAKNRI
jgi:site-specific DNA-methyltransferase (adenine-specific)